MTEEIKNLIIQTQIELEDIGKELLKAVLKTSVDYSELYGFFIKDIFVDITNITRQYLQMIETKENTIKESNKNDIKNKILRCSVKAWEKLADVKKTRIENSLKYLILSKFKSDFKEKIKEIDDLEKEIKNSRLNLSIEEKINKFKRIVQIYNTLHTTEWFKNPLLVISVCGVIIGIIAIIITIILS